MGHGKSRPLRNLSKKKGFRHFQIFLCWFQNNLKSQLIKIISECFVSFVSSKVENACLEVFAGKAYVW